MALTHTPSSEDLSSARIEVSTLSRDIFESMETVCREEDEREFLEADS
jgi:hypothetical protein